jgi:hypothetical protein
MALLPRQLPFISEKFSTMNILKYTACILSLLATSAACITACTKDTDAPVPTDKVGKVTIEFENVVGGSPLELNRRSLYATPSGDQFSVSTFRYYISNIKLTKSPEFVQQNKPQDSVFVQPESYYLIDQALDGSRKFTIENVPVGEYSDIMFTIGVDAARNSGGAQTGALAVSDMFWVWDTGYIFTKMEGRSDQSPNKALVFHIGGNNNIKTVSPAMNGKIIQVRENRTPEVFLRADLLRMFTGSTTVLFQKTNNVMGGEEAAQIAKNQAEGMFTVDRVRSN